MNDTTKPYFDVIEEPSSTEDTKWGVCFGNPNPPEEHYLACESEEQAFRIRDWLRSLPLALLPPNQGKE